jgi:hypothetical protein
MEQEEHLRVPPARAVEGEVAFVCDESGSVLETSAGIRDLLDLTVESVRGHPLDRLALPQHADDVRRGLSDARRDGASSFRVPLRTGNGHAVEAKVSAWSLDVQGKRLMVCVAAPISDARRHAEERSRRLADTHKVIGTILENALDDIPVEELLRRTLDLILWIPWLSIERRGAIFLVEDECGTLVMKAQRGLADPLLATCARVSFGTCLCGQAAATRAPIYAADLDERHTTRYPGISAHGHYCVPICSGGATLGVITTYLVPGHEASAIELEFLLAVADALAGAIIRHRAAAECRSLQRRLDEVLPPNRRC